MAMIGQSLLNVVLVLGLVTWVQYARVVRGVTLSVKEKEYVEGARASGAVTREPFVERLEQVTDEVFAIGFRQAPREQPEREAWWSRTHGNSRPGVRPRVMRRSACSDVASSRRPAASGR